MVKRRVFGSSNRPINERRNGLEVGGLTSNRSRMTLFEIVRWMSESLETPKQQSTRKTGTGEGAKQQQVRVWAGSVKGERRGLPLRLCFDRSSGRRFSRLFPVFQQQTGSRLVSFFILFPFFFFVLLRPIGPLSPRTSAASACGMVFDPCEVLACLLSIYSFSERNTFNLCEKRARRLSILTAKETRFERRFASICCIFLGLFFGCSSLASFGKKSSDREKF